MKGKSVFSAKVMAKVNQFLGRKISGTMLFAASTIGENKYFATGVYTSEGILAIDNIMKWSGRVIDRKNHLKFLLLSYGEWEEKVGKADKSVYVEDPGGMLGFGKRIRFSNLTEKDRPILHEALEHYFDLARSGCVDFGEKAADHNNVHFNQINQKTNDRGQVEYDVNWEDIGSSFRSIILLVASCKIRTMDVNFMEEFSYQLLKESEKELESLMTKKQRMIRALESWDSSPDVVTHPDPDDDY